MLTKEGILEMAAREGVRAVDIAEKFGVSRQRVIQVINVLLAQKRLVKVGVTKNAFYVLPEFAKENPEIFPNRYHKVAAVAGLEEHLVFEEVERKFTRFSKLPENVRSIFRYAFSEMLNNAIEHSQSDSVAIDVAIEKDELSFTVSDGGIGVFRNIMQKRQLPNELIAINDLLKGKVTTMPKSHSGEGIFFTSRVADWFRLASFGYELTVDRAADDTFVGKADRSRQGTKVSFKIGASSKTHLQDIFGQYTDSDGGGSLAFDTTETRVKLYKVSGINVSRSQARRILSGLEKFKVVTFDFEGVPMIGQAFADEIFRVFHEARPHVTLKTVNMNDAVSFMVGRVEGWRNKSQEKLL